MRRRLLLAGAALAVIALSGLVLVAAGGPSAATTRVVRDDLVIEVGLSGTLEAVETSLLGPPQVPEMWNFKIAMMAPEGSEVRAGTPVLGFDTSELRQRLERYLNQAESAGKQIEKQRIDLEVRRVDDRLRVAQAEAELRKAELLAANPPQLMASREYDKAVLDRELARRQLEALKAEIAATRRAGEAELASLEADHRRARTKVDELRAALGAMTVTAPRDGIVVYVTDWQNQKMKVGDSCWLADTVVEIPNLARMVAVGEVEESQSGRVRVGQPATLRLDAHPDVEYHGTVSEISSAVRQRSAGNRLKVVELRVALDRTDAERMRPGMRFKGTIEVDRVDDVLTLPLAAVATTRDGPRAYRPAWTGVRPVAVELGPHDSESVQVVRGLAEGERVLAAALPATGERP